MRVRLVSFTLRAGHLASHPLGRADRPSREAALERQRRVHQQLETGHPSCACGPYGRSDRVLARDARGTILGVLQ
jgi:hypothetical protein